ncbi:MAG: ABC transporter permease [Candidatus Bathyarchaeia archaeon]|nr:ABC transporter permease [Candidatus Bathyarchaeia archaeon]
MAEMDSKRFSSFEQIKIVVRYELLGHLRRKRLYAVLFITALIGMLPLIVLKGLNVGFPEVKQWTSTYYGYVSLIVIVSGAFFAGDAIASEFEQKTGYMLFPNPVKRTSLVIGKFIAVLAVGFYYAIGVISMWATYGTIPAATATSFAYAVLFSCCVLGLTFLFSAVLKGSMGATLLAFFTLFLILPIIGFVLTFTGNEPWYLPTHASGIITYIFDPPAERVQIIDTGGPIKIYIFYPDFLISVIVMTAYFIVTLLLSMIITNKKEMA